MNNTADTMPWPHTNPASFFTLIKLSSLCLLLACLLTGCWAADIKPASQDPAKLQSLLLVPLESPPLEVIPDPLTQRMPAYGHYDNMAMPVALTSKRYRNAGGVIIAGLLSADDEQNHPLDAPMMTADSAAELVWNPVQMVAELAQTQFESRNIDARLNRAPYPLPMADNHRNANLQHWRRATQDWYAQEQSPMDYRQLGDFDGVLEIGIGNYRIFEGQTSLQILLKLIDPITGRVIARTRTEDFNVDDAALASLQTDSQAFKRRIAALGEQLLPQALENLGWPGFSRILARR